VVSANIRIKVSPRLPARVTGVTPLKAETIGSNLTITLDISSLSELPGPVSPTLLSLLFDEADGTWKIAPVGNFFNIAGALPQPTAPQIRSVLLATAAGVYGWNPILRTDISDSTSFGRTLMGVADAAAANTALGVTAALAGKAPLSHVHTTGDISGLGALAIKNTVDIADHAAFSAGSKLIGSGAAGATPAQISLGSNLAMTGNTLNTTGLALTGAFGQAIAAATFAGATGTVAKSTGVTSVVRNATGRFTVTLAATQPDTDYIVDGGNAHGTVGRQTFNVYNKTTTTFQILTDNGASDTDFLQTWFTIYRPQ
jgi:hypothetical protein